MAGGKRISPRLEAFLMFALVVAAAALAAFIKSRVTGQPFSLNWSMVLLAGAGCAAAVYLGPPLLFRLKQAQREKSQKQDQ